MQKSETINELATALSKAQGQIQDAKKDSANPFFKSKYADLASIWEACRKPLSDNGLSVVQTIEIKEGKRVLESTLLHSSGQWLCSSLDLLPKEETEQALGSAITYTRRYALSALVGICADDDDGEAAMARPTVKPFAKAPPSTPEKSSTAVSAGKDTTQVETKPPVKTDTKQTEGKKLPDGLLKAIQDLSGTKEGYKATNLVKYLDSISGKAGSKTVTEAFYRLDKKDQDAFIAQVKEDTEKFQEIEFK